MLLRTCRQTDGTMGGQDSQYQIPYLEDEVVVEQSQEAFTHSTQDQQHQQAWPSQPQPWLRWQVQFRVASLLVVCMPLLVSDVGSLFEYWHRFYFG